MSRDVGNIRPEGRGMQEITYHVPGMHCDGCEASIRSALEKADGIEQVQVDRERKRVRVRFDEGRTSVLAVKDRIEGAGFEVA